MSNASIVTFQGLRCTKIPHISMTRAAIATFASSNSSMATTARTSTSSSDSAVSVESFSSMTSITTTSSTSTDPTTLLTPSVKASLATTVENQSLPPLFNALSSPTTTAVAGAAALLSSSSTETNQINTASSVSSTSFQIQSSQNTSLTVSSSPQTFTSQLIAETTTVASATPSTTGESAGGLSSADAHDPSRSSGNSAAHDSLRTIVGSTLGVLAFLIVALLVWYLLRRKRRTLRNPFSLANEKASANDCNSPDSAVFSGPPLPKPASPHRRYRSSVTPSSNSWTDTPHSSHVRTPSGPVFPVGLPTSSTSSNYSHEPRHSESSEDPFSDSYESYQGAHAISTPNADPFVDAGFSTSSPAMRPSSSRYSLPRWPLIGDSSNQIAAQQEMTVFHSGPRQSVALDRNPSLGSTIILPGRNSMVSSVRSDSYPGDSLLNRGPSVRTMARASIRSDPFDLEPPPAARRSVTT